MKNKHMNSHDRITIENGLNNGLSFKVISKKINKDCTTVLKEIRLHKQIRKVGSYGRMFNNCANRFNCDKFNSVCQLCLIPNTRKCSTCRKGCYHYCHNFVEEICPKLSKPPYVCNGCDDKNKCSLTKHYYYALQANKDYKYHLSQSRTGIVISQEEIDHLNDLLVSLIVEQNQCSYI